MELEVSHQLADAVRDVDQSYGVAQTNFASTMTTNLRALANRLFVPVAILLSATPAVSRADEAPSVETILRAWDARRAAIDAFQCEAFVEADRLVDVGEVSQEPFEPAADPPRKPLRRPSPPAAKALKERPFSPLGVRKEILRFSLRKRPRYRIAVGPPPQGVHVRRTDPRRVT